MGIDRIGKGGKVPPPTDVGSVKGPAAPAGTPTTSFKEVLGATNVGPTQAVAPVEGVSLEDRVRSGEITMDQFVELYVERALEPYKNLPEDRLDAVRQAMRAQLRSDPAALRAIHAATGKEPSFNDEG
jgi:hypothetical protein